MNLIDRYHDESHVREYPPSDWRRLLTEGGFRGRDGRGLHKHRPLSAMTTDVSQENVRRIHEALDALTPEQQAAFDLRMVAMSCISITGTSCSCEERLRAPLRGNFTGTKDGPSEFHVGRSSVPRTEFR